MDTYTASASRYDTMQYARCGRSGLLLPRLSLGLWHNFGSVDDSLVKEEISQVLAFYVVRAGEPCDAQEQHLEPHYIIKIASRHLQDLMDSDVWHVCELYAEYSELLVGAARRAEA